MKGEKTKLLAIRMVGGAVFSPFIFYFSLKNVFTFRFFLYLCKKS